MKIRDGVASLLILASLSLLLIAAPHYSASPAILLLAIVIFALLPLDSRSRLTKASLWLLILVALLEATASWSLLNGGDLHTADAWTVLPPLLLALSFQILQARSLHSQQHTQSILSVTAFACAFAAVACVGQFLSNVDELAAGTSWRLWLALVGVFLAIGLRRRWSLTAENDSAPQAAQWSQLASHALLAIGLIVVFSKVTNQPLILNLVAQSIGAHISAGLAFLLLATGSIAAHRNKEKIASMCFGVTWVLVLLQIADAIFSNNSWLHAANAYVHWLAPEQPSLHMTLVASSLIAAATLGFTLVQCLRRWPQLRHVVWSLGILLLLASVTLFFARVDEAWQLFLEKNGCIVADWVLVATACSGLAVLTAVPGPFTKYQTARTMAVLVGSTGALASFVVWAALVQQQQTKYTAQIEVAKQELSYALENFVPVRLRPLQMMASRLESHKLEDVQRLFAVAASKDLAHIFGTSSVALLDHQGTALVEVDTGDFVLDAGDRIKQAASRAELLESARLQQKMLISSAIILSNAKPGFVAVVPVQIGNETTNYIAATFLYEPLLAATLKTTATGYGFAISDDKNSIGQRQMDGVSAFHAKSVSASANVIGRNLQFNLVALPATRAATINLLPELLALISILAAVTAASSVFLAQAAREKSAELLELNQRLQTQIQQGETLQAKLQTILGGLSDAFLVLNRASEIEYANQHALRQFNLPQDKTVEGASIWKFLPSNMSELLKPSIDECQQTQEIQVVEINTSPNAWSVIRIYPNNNGVAVFITDATLTHQALAQLAERERQLGRAQQLGRMGSWELKFDPDQDYKIIGRYWSEETKRIVGEQGETPTASELVNATMHPEDRESANSEFMQAVRTGSTYLRDRRYLHADGQIVYVHFEAVPVFDSQGRVISVQGIVQDISERRLAEQELEKRRAELEAALAKLTFMIDASPDIILIGDERTKLVQASRAVERLLGFNPAEVIGKSVMEFVHPDDQAAVLKLMQDSFMSEVPMHFEMRSATQDGRYIPIQWSVVWSTRDRLMIGIGRDMTQAHWREQTEAAKNRALRLIANDAPLVEVYAELCGSLAQLIEGAITSVVIREEDNSDGLRVQFSADMPSDYTQAISVQSIEQLTCPCASTITENRAMISADVATETRWAAFAEYAKAHQLKACWSFPVRGIQGQAMGSLALFFRQPCAPDEQQTQLIQVAAELAGIATAREADRRRLEDQQQRLVSLFEHHPAQVFALDVDGNVQDCNLQATKEMSRDRSEILSKHLTHFMDAKLAVLFEQQLRKAISHGVTSFEGETVGHDGELYILNFILVPTIVDSKTVGFFAVVRDVSAMRNAELALRHSLARAERHSWQMQTLNRTSTTVGEQNSIADIINALAYGLRITVGAHQASVVISEDNNWKEAQRAFSFSEKYAKFASPIPHDAHLTGSGIYTVVAEQNMAICLNQKDLEAHPAWRGFGAYAAKHPPIRGLLAVPLIAANGRNMGLLQLSDKYEGEFTADDQAIATQFALMAAVKIERSRLLEELQSTHSVLSVRDRFFQLSLEIFCVVGSDLLIKQVNPAVERVLGYSVEELTDKPIINFVHPDDWAESFQISKTYRKAGDSADYINRFRRADESYCWLSWSSFLAPDGRVYAVGRDIGSRMRAESDLDQAMLRLRQSNQELEEFAFVASHDLQEPLRKVKVFGERLDEQYADQLGDRGREYLQRMTQAAERMRVLIEDLLNYSRVSTKGQPFVSVNLGEVLNEVLGDLETLVDSSGAEIVVGEMLSLHSDKTQMRQLLQNLIANSLKFSAPGRAPKVSINAEIFIDTSKNSLRESWCRLTVTDNGIGFDNKYADQIFAPFQRLHGRAEYSGTGIGLAVVRKIVGRHGGRVFAKGIKNQGASFIVELPLVQATGRDNAIATANQ